MTIHVLGLGESLSNYKPDGSMTIGVNDIHSRIETDFVVCVDKPTAFTPERAIAIFKTKCRAFYSQLDYWEGVQNFKQIEFNPGRGILTHLDSDKYCYSISSPFVAVVLAYKMGATNIVLHGVDFQTHKNFKDEKRKRAIDDFINLDFELSKRGVTLYVGSTYSALVRFLPLWKK